jgi:hypothetical protein
MTDTKHTPGPWMASHNGYYWQIDSEKYGEIGNVCASSFSYFNGAKLPADKCEKFAEANARLIAAAPDLLSFAEFVRDLAKAEGNDILLDAANEVIDVVKSSPNCNQENGDV